MELICDIYKMYLLYNVSRTALKFGRRVFKEPR